MAKPTSLPSTVCCTLERPSPKVLLVTLARPEQLNCLNQEDHHELDGVWQWFDSSNEFLVAILTGSGRAFSGGANLREWNTQSPEQRGRTTANGFGGLSLRRGKKPIIAALNGFSIGGATEMVINCDMVVSTSKAYLALPDTKVGLTGFGGTFATLVRRVGRQRATDMCLTGRNISAEEASNWGLVDRVVKPGSDVVQTAVDLANLIAANSPDAVIATRDGLLAGEDSLSSIEAGHRFISKWLWLFNTENCDEGITAFNQKRKPVWKPSKL